MTPVKDKQSEVPLLPHHSASFSGFEFRPHDRAQTEREVGEVGATVVAVALLLGLLYYVIFF